MDRLTVAFSGRLIVSLVLALIGFMAVQYGYKLFVTGVGLKKDKGKLKFNGPKFKVEMVTSSVGGVLMLTSLGWGAFTYLSLPTLSPDRVASTDTIIRAFALGDKTQLTAADKNAITDFAKTAKLKLQFNPNAKLLVVTTPGTDDWISKRKAVIYDTLEKAGFPESKIDKNVMEDTTRFNAFVKALDPTNLQNNLDTALVLRPNS
jgi:hypothetical protein